MTVSKEVYRSGPYKNIYAQAVKVGNTLYLSGQVGVSSDGTVGADIVEQTAIAYSNIRDVLEKYNASAQNIVDETWFVTDVSDVMANMEPVFATRAEFFGEIPEVCQTLVQVSALVLPGLQLEIKCVAHLPD